MTLGREMFAKAIVHGECTIRQAMKAIDESSMEIVLIVDDANRLVGLATDGDIRRAIIDGVNLESPVRQIMNTKFTAMPENISRHKVLTLMKKRYLKQMPIVDSEGKIVDLLLLKDIWAEKVKDNKVVLMAGGLGTRLRPLTDDMPKPMLKVGDKPILELIINHLKEYGYKDIIISLNYKGDIIERYFQDGSDFNVNIEYVHEKKRLGTAGALRLAKDLVGDKPFIVMNSDLLTKVNFDNMIKEHKKGQNELTLAVKSYDYTVPYGVVSMGNGRVQRLLEKPTQNYLISAGIYCLNPSVIDLIPEEEYCDITEVIEKLIRADKKVGSYLVREYWMDIGNLKDYDQAVEDVSRGII